MAKIKLSLPLPQDTEVSRIFDSGRQIFDQITQFKHQFPEYEPYGSMYANWVDFETPGLERFYSPKFPIKMWDRLDDVSKFCTEEDDQVLITAKKFFLNVNLCSSKVGHELQKHIDSLKSVITAMNDIFYSAYIDDCNSLEGLAKRMVEEDRMGSVNSDISAFIDYKKMGEEFYSKWFCCSASGIVIKKFL